MSHDNTVTYKKLASRWDRRTLPSEPRHLCFVYIIGIVVILSTIVIVSTGVGCTNFVCPHRGLANGTLRFSRKHVFLNTVPLCCRPSTYGTPENAVPCKMVGKRRITGSRSFKVIRIGTNRKPRCDFLLLTNMAISLIVSETLRRNFWRKLQKSPFSRFAPRLVGVQSFGR